MPVPPHDRPFETWVANRTLPSFGTNAGAPPLAFQRWHHFKEAFAPELIRLAVNEHGSPPRSCLDPFGGSGTTALAAQFLGLASTTVEVNPFLADVIRAKTSPLSSDALAKAFGTVCRLAREERVSATAFYSALPETFVEPGREGRWLFSAPVADRIASYVSATEHLHDSEIARFFRVILGGILVDVSNAVINGKGRRYRRGWRDRPVPAEAVDLSFRDRALAAIADVHRFSRYPRPQATVIRGDARKDIPRRRYDLAVFSPPYPNSFDYTDVYNIELWMLGYLQDSESNRRLRLSTLTSHVQLQRQYSTAPTSSPLLCTTVAGLNEVRDSLWSRWLPSMVGSYFHDLMLVLRQVRKQLADDGSCWLVVGDSKYGGVHVPTGAILTELATANGWMVANVGPNRSMRSSAQHGGREELKESLLVLRKHRD